MMIPDHYQGHRPNADPVQAHSAGDHYPYVVQVRDTVQADGKLARTYEVLPCGASFLSFKAAEKFALGCKLAAGWTS